MSKISKKQIKELQHLIDCWKPKPFNNQPDMFFRPTNFKQKHNGIFAFQCYYDYDTNGIALPDELEDPEILADLIQAKRNQAFNITQWKETYEKRDEYPIWPEEYFEHPGMTLKLFKTLFGREPTPEILKSLNLKVRTK